MHRSDESTSRAEEGVNSSERRRREDQQRRERRLGPSRLSTWSGRQLLLACLIWIGLVLALTVLGIAASIAMNHETAEVRIALSRSNVIGLIGVLLIPPLCLTVQWWRMRRRRRNGRETSV